MFYKNYNTVGMPDFEIRWQCMSSVLVYLKYLATQKVATQLFLPWNFYNNPKLSMEC